MKIVACIKRVPSTEATPKLSPDGRGIDTANLAYMTSFYDEIAVEQAVLTKEASGGEVTVLTLGPAEASKEVRECIAKGADAGIIMTDPEWGSRDNRSTAKILAAKLGALGAELCFMGRVATDRDSASVGPMVATLLGWSCVTDVVELNLDDGAGTAQRETEQGLETISFSLPAIITCDKGLNEPRYAGLKGIMAAKKKPLENISFEEVPSQATACSLALPPERAAGRIVGEGPDAVPALMEALRNEAKVL
ncbi:MAG: electron transfer flavoprotein subunit beta [Planctomycetes bacterium]|jgi:electron transfer flavoprotein beta subunit|nr:electron transfer flavoprotein subunit beta [Planctomycetota bacterium]HJO26257.1 electron transfer flavoprotein subunit beta/FixA family protein [Planctomycetota bacterium]